MSASARTLQKRRVRSQPAERPFSGCIYFQYLPRGTFGRLRSRPLTRQVGYEHIPNSLSPYSSVTRQSGTYEHIPERTDAAASVEGGWPGGGADGVVLSGDGGAIPIGERLPTIAAGSTSSLLPPLPVAVYASPAQVAPPDGVGFERGRVRVGPGNVG